MQLTLKTKLIAGLVLMVTLTVVAIFMVTAVSIMQRSQETFTKSITQEMKLVDDIFSVFFNGAKDAVSMMAEHPLAVNPDGIKTTFIDDTENTKAIPDDGDIDGWAYSEYLSYIQNSHKAFFDVYIGTRNGSFIMGRDTEMPGGYDPRTRPWYKEASANPGVALVGSTYMSTTGDAMISVSRGVKGTDGSIASVAAIDITLKELTTIIAGVKVGETGYVVLVQGDGTIIANPDNPDLNFKNVSEGEEAFKTMFAMESGEARVELGGVEYDGVVVTSPGLGWKYIVLMPTSEVMAPVWALLWQMLIVISLCLIIATAVIWWFLGFAIIGPLEKVVGFVREVADGVFSRRLNIHRTDEIGVIYAALDSMADGLEAKSQLASKIAEGNLTEDATMASDKDMLGLALQQMVDNLRELIGRIDLAALQIDGGSREVSDSSQALSQGATEQAASLEELTSSMTEIGSQTGTNAENASKASELAIKARTAAENGSKEMDSMVQAMTGIHESSQAIAKIIKVIDEIAFQTNLLALNAAVEAARAGRHGKGFAVVAEEVRNLAGRSAKAAEETTELIEGSVEKVENGNSIAAQTAESLAGIVEDVSASAALVAEISKASTEQADGVKQVNVGLQQIDQVTQQNTASAEETASASEELSSQAAMLRKLLERFTLSTASSRKVSVAPTKVQPLPQAAKSRPSSPPSSPSKAANQEGGWGSSPDTTFAPSEVISLDDDEFGKY